MPKPDRVEDGSNFQNQAASLQYCVCMRLGTIMKNNTTAKTGAFPSDGLFQEFHCATVHVTISYTLMFQDVRQQHPKSQQKWPALCEQIVSDDKKGTTDRN